MTTRLIYKLHLLGSVSTLAMAPRLRFYEPESNTRENLQKVVTN